MMARIPISGPDRCHPMQLTSKTRGFDPYGAEFGRSWWLACLGCGYVDKHTYV